MLLFITLFLFSLSDCDDKNPARCPENYPLKGFKGQAMATTKQIFVKKPDGKTIVVPIEETDTVETVKERIQEKSSIPVEQQKLRLGQKELTDTKTLKEYGIRKGTTVNLETN